LTYWAQVFCGHSDTEAVEKQKRLENPMAVVNSNLNALASQHAMSVNSRLTGNAMQQLSTGRRINSSADDAAGLAISSKLGSRIVSLDMAVRNANDGISMLETADGAAGGLSDVLLRMRDLSVQAGNDTNSNDDRDAMQTEVAALQSQLGNILNNTEWNGMKVLKGEAGNSGTVSFQVGASSSDAFTLSMSTLDTGSLASAQTTGAVDVSSQSGAASALEVIDSALTEIDQARTDWGATANRLMHAANNSANVSLNSQASRSTLVDTDYAKTTADLARAMILEEAGAAMLTQANQQPAYVLALLR
jgi:flagellin